MTLVLSIEILIYWIIIHRSPFKTAKNVHFFIIYLKLKLKCSCFYNVQKFSVYWYVYLRFHLMQTIIFLMQTKNPSDKYIILYWILKCVGCFGISCTCLNKLLPTSVNKIWKHEICIKRMQFSIEQSVINHAFSQKYRDFHPNRTYFRSSNLLRKLFVLLMEKALFKLYSLWKKKDILI